MSEDSEDQAPNAKDQSAMHEIVPGLTVEKPSGKFSVTSVENDKVRFSYESPNGTVRSSLPLNTFRKMVGTEGAVAQYKPSLTTNTEPRAAIEQFSPEELAEFRRLEALYRSLPQGDRYYIVSRWDDEQGLEPTYKRENYRNEAPPRVRTRKFWTVVALIPAILFILWIGRLIQAGFHSLMSVADSLCRNASARRKLWLFLVERRTRTGSTGNASRDGSPQR